MTRRAWLCAALPLLASPLLSPHARAAAHRPARRDVLRVGVLLPPAGDAMASAESYTEAVSHGLTLGAEEAARTAALFDLELDVRSRRVGSAGDVGRTTRTLIAEGVAAIVSALRGAECGTFPAFAGEAGVLVLTTGCTADAARRGETCRPFAAHLSPTPATIRRARERLAGRRGPTRGATTTLALWHHTLRRFGAEQLNERFRRRFARGMTSEAWAAWVAMKVLTEAALRGRSTRGADIARYLASPGARFDGHKGEPLAFDPRTGELRQPLYVVSDDGPGGEVVATLSVDEAYDVPSARQEARACWSNPGDTSR